MPREYHSTINRLESQLTPERIEKINRILRHRTRYFTMVLEDLKDPHNISAVIRTSEVFGFQDVHVIEEINSYSISKPIVRGSLKWLDIYKYKNRGDCLEALKKKGYQIAVASTTAETPLLQIDFSRPTAFYLGSESLGNHPHTLARADVRFRIPQYGLTESMNVSVCAGVLMSSLRQWIEERAPETVALSPEEKEKLKAVFYKRCVLGMENEPPVHRGDGR